MKIYIDKETSTISSAGKPMDYTYFSYLWHEIKYGTDKGDVVISLGSEYKIYINGKIRWKKKRKKFI